MEKDIYSFYELVKQYEVKIPILQRDYAQGRENNISICENFLKALKESVLQDKTINLVQRFEISSTLQMPILCGTSRLL